MSRAFLKALGLIDAQVVATPGTDDVGGPKASQISELRGAAKWHDPPEVIEEEDDLLTGEELKLFQPLRPSSTEWCTAALATVCFRRMAPYSSRLQAYARLEPRSRERVVGCWMLVAAG